MVLLLVGGVGGVFLFFTLIAVCYRYSHTHPPVSFAMYFRWWEITPSLRTVDGLVGAFAWLWQLATPPTPLPLPSLSDPWQQSFQLQANAANCSTLRWCSFPDILVFHIYISYACKEREQFLSLLKSLRVIGVADQARIRVTEALVLNICGTSVDCVNVSSVPTGHLQLLWCLSPTFSSLGCWLVLLSLHVFSYLACNFLRCGKKIYMFSVYFMLDPWLTNGSSRYKAVLGQSDRHWLYLVFSFFYDSFRW